LRRNAAGNDDRDCAGQGSRDVACHSEPVSPNTAIDNELLYV
jgi:hypothetical protein